ncbi:PIN domain-containing protein [Candidatus Woesearchaeota archaeon]|nr:PIN domain-containing protein [Candidatus Woesearchaeota archaeon]
MKIILDVNVILSALIRDSTTRKIILNSEFDFYFPEPSLHKIRKYKSYILEKSGLSEEGYNKIMEILFKYIQLVPTEEIEKNWNEAKKTMEHIDPEDVVFIATALSISDSVIWSDDSHFEKQNKVKVLKTDDMVK